MKKLNASRCVFLCALFCSSGAFVSSAFAGPDWVENVDAGSRLQSAQITTGVGEIDSIFGSLGASGATEPDYEDMYIIRIDNPATFRFEILDAPFSPAVYLFNITLGGEAIGLLGKQADGGNDVVLGNQASDATGAQVTLPGLYALVITFEGNAPRSRTGDIFNFTNESETSGPDGSGGINPLETYERGQSYPLVTYLASVDGVEFAQVPSPGALGMLGLAGLMAARRRR
jgi:hypothetical protein